MKKNKFVFLFFVLTSLVFSNEQTLVVSTNNGLCNRLRSIATGHVLAQYYHRNLEVVWAPESEVVGFCSWSDLFDAPPLRFVPSLPSKGAFYGKKLGGESNGLVVLNLLVEEDLLDDSDVQQYGTLRGCRRPGSELMIDIPSMFSSVSIQAIQNIRPISMDPRKFLEEKKKFYQTLVPRAEIKREIDRFAKNISKKTIGVHIRTTDQLEKRFKKSVPAFQNFEAAIEQSLNLDPESNFFLCSDSYLVIQHFKRRYPGKILTFDKHRFDGENEIERFSKTGTKRALIDLFLLSKTHKIIGTKFSSFSYEAAAIGGIDFIEVTHD